MIWEAYSDTPTELIIKNLDRQWIRHLEVEIKPSVFDEVATLLKDLEEYDVSYPGLTEEMKKHIKVIPLKKKS